MFGTGEERRSVTVPDGFGTAAAQVPKTKTKTKYLILTFWGWLAFKDPGVMKAAIVALLTREAGTAAAEKRVRRMS